MLKTSKRIICVLLSVLILISCAAVAGATGIKYTVTPITEGGGYVYMISSQFNAGDIVTLRAVPNEGFAFYRWASDDVIIAYPANDMIQFYMPAQNVEIYAVFAVKQPEVKETVSVTFDSMGGTDFGTTYVEVGGYVDEPTNVPTREGYTFAGWYSDSTCTLPYNFSTPLYTTTIIYAKWAALENTSTNSFIDVNKSDWFYDCVMTLAERNIISGMGNSVFAPDKNVSRAQFATILANLAGANLSSSETPFNDVEKDAWYAKAVAWAYNSGIVNGKSETEFAPNDNVSRQDMAVMIKRYVENVAKITLVESNVQAEFADDVHIAAYATEAVYAMQRAGIINGKPGNIFDPTANAKRSEAARMIYVLLNLIEL